MNLGNLNRESRGVKGSIGPLRSFMLFLIERIWAKFPINPKPELTWIKVIFFWGIFLQSPPFGWPTGLVAIICPNESPARYFCLHLLNEQHRIISSLWNKYKLLCWWCLKLTKSTLRKGHWHCKPMQMLALINKTLNNWRLIRRTCSRPKVSPLETN